MATYSYSGNPADSTLDKMRFYIQDTASPWMLSNEEILFAIDGYATLKGAAVFLLQTLLTRYSMEAEVVVEGLTIKTADRVEALRKTLKTIEANGVPDDSAAAGDVGSIMVFSEDPSTRPPINEWMWNYRA